MGRFNSTIASKSVYFSIVSYKQKIQINNLNKQKHAHCTYILYTWSYKAFKRTVVNRALPSLQGVTPFNSQVFFETASGIYNNSDHTVGSHYLLNIKGLEKSLNLNLK